MAKAHGAQLIVTSPVAEGGGSAEGMLASLDKIEKGRGPAPVHLWNPPFCGDIDMCIARDGTWFYQGTPIGRPGLVRLFANILKVEDDKYFLVTPVEKVGITVDDAPFVAVDFEVTDANGQTATRMIFETSVGDRVTMSAETPLRVVNDPSTGEPSPYIMVRAGLEALIDRKSFYRMVEFCSHAVIDGQSWFGIHSAGAFFPVIASDRLD